jgi:hypothetical protein
MNSSFVHAVAASLPNSGHSLLSMGEFYPANIPCPSHGLSQLKLNLLLNPYQLKLRHRIIKNCEYPAQPTQVSTFFVIVAGL